MAGCSFRVQPHIRYLEVTRLCRPASIRIQCEPNWLHASWGSRFSRCCYLANGLQTFPRDGRSHLNSANFLSSTKILRRDLRLAVRYA
jgi:hypothetical protein